MLPKSADRQPRKMKIAIVTSTMLIGIIAISCTILLWRKNTSYERSSASNRYPLSLTNTKSIDDTMLTTSKWSSTFTPSTMTTTEIVDEEGNIYVGEINSDGKKHGYGKFTFLSGQMKYSGQWNNNHMSGNGKMWWSDGHRYTGEWKNSKRSGYGVMIWPNGMRYEGNWVEGRKQGQGSQTWPDGRQYKGEWYDDLPISNNIQSSHNGQRRERPGSVSKTIMNKKS